MLKGIHKLLDEADVVVHFYGKKFDIPMLNSEFIKHKMAPPSPYKQVDLKKTIADEFRFPSNKLEYVAKALGIGAKIKEGITFELWLGCLEGDQRAWAKMRQYNCQDTVLLERLYNRLLPWIRNHPVQGTYSGKTETCPNCGSVHLQKRGVAHTKHLTYARYVCTSCHKWSRSTTAIKPTKKQDRRVDA